MSDITRLSQAIQTGDSKAAEELLPLVYQELRKLAAQKMASEAAADHTLQPTALVHEAWLRLAGRDANSQFANRAHFFAAAAEGMRRILVERARRKQRLRHGGDQQRVEVDMLDLTAPGQDEKILLVNDALQSLAAEDPVQAEVVKLRFYGGLGNAEIAAVLDVSEKTVQRYWAHAKAWLYEHIRGQS